MVSIYTGKDIKDIPEETKEIIDITPKNDTK
jgi:hypothetical protein